MPGEHLHLLLLGVVDEEGNLASDGKQAIVGYGQSQERCHGCIRGITTGVQQPNPSSNSVSLTGRYRTTLSGGLPANVGGGVGVGDEEDQGQRQKQSSLAHEIFPF